MLEISLNRFAARQLDKLEQKLLTFCKELLDAAVQFRFENPEAHNFTGNLVGSIAVGLWRKGNLVSGFLPGAANNVERVTRKKMTAPNWYKFTPEDYDTVPNTVYHAEVKTNRGYGRDDAKMFLDTFKADPKAEFIVAVAYTTEYAEWVETHRHTTGFFKTVEWIKLNAPKVAKA